MAVPNPIRARPPRHGPWLCAAGLLLVLSACPACSERVCDGPARLPPSVLVHADTFFSDHRTARAKVCATECTTLTADDNGASLGQQLVVLGADENTKITLVATVAVPRQRPVDSRLDVHLIKHVSGGVCGTYTSYATDVHLDAAGRLAQGRS